MKLEDLTIVIPCYNEEGNIGSVLQELIPFCETHFCHLIVVNDGSKDGTAKILEQFESEFFTVVTHKRNRGYGGAIKSGVISAKTDYVVTMDADGQHIPADVIRLYEKRAAMDADMVVGERPVNSDASLYRKIGKKIIFLITRMNVAQDLDVKDINSGMKLYDRNIAVQLFSMLPDDMSYSDTILLLFYKFSCLCTAVPIDIRKRQNGTSTINTMTAVDTIREIMGIALLFSPFSIFCKIVLFFILAGLLWAMRCYLLNSSFSVGSSTCFTVAVVLFFNGLLLEQICRLRRQGIYVRNYKKVSR